MEISQIKMYELLRTKFSDKEAESIVHVIGENMDAKINQRKHELATKDDMCRLREDMANHRAELTRTIYTTSMGQLFAIIVSVISLILLILKK
jgi:hypothetical protein